MKQDELWYVLRQSSPRIVLPFWGRYHFEALKLPSSALWLTDCVDSFTSDPTQTRVCGGDLVGSYKKKKQGKKNTPRRSSTSDRVVIGSLCWIWLTKGMTRVFYDQALSKVKQNYCDQQNSLSSNGKRTLSAWMRLKHNQISVKFTKFIFYFIFLVLFCFVFSYIHYKLGLSTISAPQVSATANRLHKSGGPLVNKNWGWHKVYKFITYSLIRRYGRSSLGARCERWLKWFNWKGCFTLSEKVENIYAI